MEFLLHLVSGHDQPWPYGTPKEAGKSGSLFASGQSENWGRPSGGADFLIERPGDGFKVP